MTVPNSINYKTDLNSDSRSIQLIRIVKKHPILYNCNLEHYNDFSAKEPVWEKVHIALYPNFNELPNGTKQLIKKFVRRRWKCLRNNLAKTARKNQNRPRSSRMLSELEFLLPYIRTLRNKRNIIPTPCSWKRNANVQNHNFNYDDNDENSVVNEADDNNEDDDGEGDEYYSDFIDLSYDDKPVLKVDPAERSFGSRTDQSFCRSTFIYPTVHITSGADNSYIENSSERTSTETTIDQWANSCCVTDFSDTRDCETSTFGTVNDDSINWIRQQQQQHEQITSDGQRTRKHSYSPSYDDDPPDDDGFQSKILKILTDIDREEDRSDRDDCDEDRMFLLSLVSDLRNISTAKKMLVKAEIVTAIARGQQ